MQLKLFTPLYRHDRWWLYHAIYVREEGEKLKILIVTFFMVAILVVAGCGKAELEKTPETGNNGTEITKPVSPPDENPDVAGENADISISDFSIICGATSVSLMQWDYELNLEEHFGIPLKEEVRQLGPGSDTFQGSYVKELKYPGLELELFSPKDNGKTFWLRSIQVSDKKYETARGVKVGDSLGQLETTYPELKPILDNRKDPNNRGYMIEEGIYNYITFEVNEGLIVMMKIYHEFA